jgi:thermostable 8-oxoguanine DNA glycosylase
MSNSLPKDPMLCLSVVNTKLRDYYSDLDSLCEDMGVEKESLIEKLKTIDYLYDEKQNQFI